MEKKLSNRNLNKAKDTKEDEFYTQIHDIERELGHYKEHFKNKVIFLNCDDPEESNFWKYFFLNFKFLGLKKLIATHFGNGRPSYKLEKVNGDIIKTPLKQNGDFRSPECVEILKEADIVVTNPPFSLLREYIAQLIEYDKKFLIIGNINAISYKEIFKLIKENKIWLGYNCVRYFKRPDGSMYETARSFWYTNLDIKKRHEDFLLYKTYKGHEDEYPKYDNYDAINISKATEIPSDYKGKMGVPVTFLDKHNPEQFEIIGQMATTKVDEFNYGYPYINGKKKYARIIIRNKKI
jgi:hypothetical protein